MCRKIMFYICLLYWICSISSCSERESVEYKVDGLWEVVFATQEEINVWYDSIKFMDQIFFFDGDNHECSLPEVMETFEKRVRENHRGHWFVNKKDSLWTITLSPKHHILEGVYNLSFFKDTVHEYYGNTEVRYFMRLKNEEWDILCRKGGIILNPW